MSNEQYSNEEYSRRSAALAAANNEFLKAGQTFYEATLSALEYSDAHGLKENRAERFKVDLEQRLLKAEKLIMHPEKVKREAEIKMFKHMAIGALGFVFLNYLIGGV